MKNLISFLLNLFVGCIPDSCPSSFLFSGSFVCQHLFSFSVSTSISSFSHNLCLFGFGSLLCWFALALFLSFLSILICSSIFSSVSCCSLSLSLHSFSSLSPSLVTSLGMAQRLNSDLLFITWWSLLFWIRTDSRIWRSKELLVNFRTLTPNSTSDLLSSPCISSRCLSMWLDVFSCSTSYWCSNVRSYTLRAVSPI